MILAVVRVLGMEAESIADYVGRLGGPITGFLNSASFTTETLRSLTGLIGLAVQGLPVVLYPGILLLAMLNQHWSRLARWVALGIAASIGMAALQLWFDASRAGTIYYYSWEGWYWILFFGGYLSGIAGILILPVTALLSKLRGLPLVRS
jgi:hypothetical protein